MLSCHISFWVGNMLGEAEPPKLLPALARYRPVNLVLSGLSAKGPFIAQYKTLMLPQCSHKRISWTKYFSMSGI